MPFRIVPERSEVAEDDSQSATSQLWHVLDEHPPWPQGGNRPAEFFPEPAPRAFEACAFPGERDVLTGEAAAEEVDRFVNGPPVDAGDVAEVRHVGPVLGQHRAGVGIDLAEERLLPFQPAAREGEAADAAEEITDDEGLRH